MALDAMNNSGLWTTLATQGIEPKALNAMNNIGLSLIRMTSCHELMGSRCYEQVRVMDDMNNSNS